MPELTHPMPYRTKSARTRGRTAAPLEPPPTPLRYADDGTWRPPSPGWGNRPGEPDTRPHTTTKGPQR